MTDQAKDGDQNAFSHSLLDDPMSNPNPAPLDDVTAHHSQAATTPAASDSDPIVIQLSTANDEDIEPIEPENDSKRVKVYQLVGSRWDDQGTALCYGHVSEETNEARIIARSETNLNNIILSTLIRPQDVYQKQQETLIVWTEPDGVDYALSFQDPEGCLEVWSFITEVQRHMNGADERLSSPYLGSEPSVTTASIIRSGHLPKPAIGIIGEIERAIKALARTAIIKERICEYIVQEEYVKQLINVLTVAEETWNLENLHALCSCMQTILMLNDHTMYEHILDDELFFGVVGMLEYDPDFPTHKANYRDFLASSTHYHQPIPLGDESVRRKIHYTYRLQFLKDVVLARALDDSTFNVLNSCILFNQIDIIQYVQLDAQFLRTVVGLYVDEEMLSGGGVQPAAGAAAASGSGLGAGLGIGMKGRDGEERGGGDTDDDEEEEEEEEEEAGQRNTDSGDGKTPTKTSDGSEDSSSNSSSANGTVTPKKRKRDRQKGKAKQKARALEAEATGDGRDKRFAFAPPEELTREGIQLRREVVLLVQQLCVMGKNVQLPVRIALFRALVDRGILFCVQWALDQHDAADDDMPSDDGAGSSTQHTQAKVIVSAAGEILTALLDHDLNGVRGHVLKQVVAIDKERTAGKKGADKAETLLMQMCRVLGASKDLAVQNQVGEALKALLDQPVEADATPTVNPKLLQTRKDDPGTEKFFEMFYTICAEMLFKPLTHDIPEFQMVSDPVLPLSRETVNRLVFLCDFLSTFIQQHSFRSHFFVLSSNISSHVATLLSSKDKHLRLAAFRFFRVCLKMHNSNLINHLMKHDVFQPIIRLTMQESKRDNLLTSTCQEFFEHLRWENYRNVIEHVMSKYEADIRKLSESPIGGHRFISFIRRWEINNEPPPPPESAKPGRVPMRQMPGHALQRMEAEAAEDSYFLGDDWADDDEDSVRHNEARTGNSVHDEDADLTDGPIPLISHASTLKVPLRGNSNSSGAAARSRLRQNHRGVGRPRRSSLDSLAMAPGGSLSPSSSPTSPRVSRPMTPTLTPPRTPPLGALSDYGEDDDDTDEGEGTGGRAAASSASASSSSSLPSLLPPIGESMDPEDAELEALVGGKTLEFVAAPPSPTSMAATTTALGPAISLDDGAVPPLMLKRRKREEDDEEDDDLVRLAKRGGGGSSSSGSNGGAGASAVGSGSGNGANGGGAGTGTGTGGVGGGVKTEAQTPKKMRLKLGSSSSSLGFGGNGGGGRKGSGGSGSGVLSEKGTKDADTG